ncbi:DUF3326 domain-containing protein [Streptomyces alboniger]|uniref:DUF3326 domain-containing protein n=1 Tax=Streptomyces alboniger TaxID=132473 RepID=A0A5J6HU89_STRAD|nr:DUF3326 domain-containing protein [Streptomyces alboniger]QEV21871.1 DUF3326 domain-containing protein [Streptomyces alboniger]
MLTIEHDTIVVPKTKAMLTWPAVVDLLAPRYGSQTIPVRLALTEQADGQLTFEVTGLRGAAPDTQRWGSLWDFQPRRPERTGRFVVLHVVPTGIRAEIGGFAGDATPATNLLASTCDYLLTHPNVVTASDLYWGKENVLYLEGNLLSRFLLGQIHLRPAQTRRLGVLIDKPHAPEYLDNVQNAIHACRTVGGLTIEQVWVSEQSLRAEVFYTPSGRALGNIAHMDHILEIALEAEHHVDALAITSEIDVSPKVRRAYYAGKRVANPWGGVEAVLTHAVTTMTGLPAAHAPMLTSHSDLVPPDGVVDPRDGAEVISTSFLCSVLRGLSAAPQPSPAGSPTLPGDTRLTPEDVGALVLPAGAVGGIPAFAALAQNIPLVLVRENNTVSSLRIEDILGAQGHGPAEVHLVDNYLEAAGLLTALRERLSVDALRRPVAVTQLSER